MIFQSIDNLPTQSSKANSSKSSNEMPPPAEGATEAAGLRERMHSHLSLLRSESAILDRIVYKNKNQHRRCHYFKALLKVRRDVRLLLSAGVEEILTNLFRIIEGANPEQRLHALHGLKRKNVGGKHNFHDRLLGVARLLSQMTEPLVVAAVQISSLLAHSFFMGFSLIILSLLARIRVLLQQILLDSVTVYNQITILCQNKHSVKLIHEGIEAYREYHPPCREFVNLKCVWEGDKFVLHEDLDDSLTKTAEANDTEPSVPEMSAIIYDIVELPTVGKEPTTNLDHGRAAVELEAKSLPIQDQHDDGLKVIEALQSDNDGTKVKDEYPPGLLPQVPWIPMTRPCSQNSSGGAVAFVPVRKSSTSPGTDDARLRKKARVQSQSESRSLLAADESDDPFFRLFTTGSKGKLL